jgi:hypothetical protein
VDEKPDQSSPIKLDHAKPAQPRPFQDALTDFVRQEMEAGRLKPALRSHRIIFWLIMMFAVLGSIYLLLTRH